MTYTEILTAANWAIGRTVLGEAASHKEALARMQALISGTCFSHFENAAHFLQAYFFLKHGDKAQGSCALAAALRLARDSRYAYPQTIRFSSIVGELFAEALRSGIEVTYVEETIRRIGIHAPADAPACWPWPLKIQALGGFGIICDGVRLDFSGKTPKKPLALLKCLIAFGGLSVPEYRITDALWPGEDADLATKTLDVNLVRLKKLLGQPRAVIASGEMLSLNAKLFWIDVWAFERAAEQAIHDAGDDAASHEAMNLYRGEFLPGDAGSGWTLKPREGLRGRLFRLVESAARRFESQQHWDSAIECYQRGLQSDDLAEPFYQGLMRCYRALGQHSEAMNAYRKLRQMLSVVLGMAPSESTQALARKLQTENPA